jgi:hypothetical protein
VLASEWLKIRTMRSAFHTLGVVAAGTVLCAAWSWYIAHYYDGLSPARQATVRAAPPEQFLVLLSPICMAVLGVLAITSEYASGMIRTSLTVAPRRRTLLAAKSGIVAGVTLVTGLVSTCSALLLGRAIVGGRTIAAFATPMSSEIPILLALTLSVTVTALVGLGLGVVLRSTAGAITIAARLADH